MKNKLNYEDIYIFVKNHNLEQIISIEAEDPQFIAIKNIYIKIQSDYPNNINKLLFLDLVTKISLVTYQIGGTWEEWRKDVMDYIYNLWLEINQEAINNIARREELLQNTKYNRRLKNMKLARLAKIGNLREVFAEISDYENAYGDMNIYYHKISARLWSDKFAKTPLFATKMFWYISRVIFDKLVIYPDWLSIPLDSRLKQIYISIHQDNKIDNKIVIKYFDELAYNNKISPLHLDSLLWLKYWKFIQT